MKYSWEFKLECIENYKIGKSNVKPKHAKCNQIEFSHKVREWIRIYELHGIACSTNYTINSINKAILLL